MRHLKHATKLFFLGWLVGSLVGVVGGGTPAFLGWRFSFLDLDAGTIRILSNNLIAAFFASLGPLLAARILKIKPEDMDGIAFLYMIPTLIVFVNGFSLGFFTGSIAGRLTPMLIFLSVAPHGVFEIPAIILSSAIGFTNIEDLGVKGLVDGRYIPLILLLIFTGGFIEGGVTAELPVLRDPVRILEVSGPEQATAGVLFPLNVTIENSGILDTRYALIIRSDTGAFHGNQSGGFLKRLYGDSAFPLGLQNLSTEVALLAPGRHNVTAEVTIGSQPVGSRSMIIDIKDPHIEISEVDVPPLYAGENATIHIGIENMDDVERTMELVFESTTGSLGGNVVELGPMKKLNYSYHTIIGQPGPRKFKISLLWNGVTLSEKEESTTVQGLRIRPRIISIFIPDLVVNRSSTVTVEIENAGSKGGDVSLLAFDIRMPQIHRTPDSVGVILDRRHLGTRLFSEADLYLDAGEKKTVKLEFMPREAGSSDLLFYALRGKVISDVTTHAVEVLGTGQ